ncbi:MAG: hypothetical protein PF508_19400 [Spirochaeta sp.]|jgi:hypothetical protein|nr:hypothetical protein [Spirochaeta sp.]
MTITREQIDRMRADGRLRIDAQLEEMIIAQYGVEPESHEYSEQDLHEQIRKLIDRYNQEHAVHHGLENHSKPWDPTATQANPPTSEKELMA